MSKMYEEFTNSAAHNGQIAGADDFFSSQTGDFSAGGGQFGVMGDSDSLYPHLKEMF